MVDVFVIGKYVVSLDNFFRKCVKLVSATCSLDGFNGTNFISFMMAAKSLER